MPYNMNCNQCGALMIKSQRTGKMYCSEKCWLKNQPQQGDNEVMNALRKVYDKLNGIESLCNSINYKVGKESLADKKTWTGHYDEGRDTNVNNGSSIPETSEQKD